MDPDFRQVQKPAKSVKAEPVQPPTETPDLENFQTPDEVTAADSLDAAEKDSSSTEAKSHSLAALWHKLRAGLQSHKKEWLTSAAIVLVCGSVTGFILIKTNQHPTVAAEKPAHIVHKAAPKPTTVPSTLTGLPVDPSINQRPVTAVMVENSLQARPQSGLGQAGVVFEAIAEGGITRFLALYQDTAPANVGPIRSARPYFEQWALGFDAGYAHVGGSPEALADLKQWNVRDLDQFYNSSYYHRISSREAPHNVYTGIPTLNQLETSKGYTSSTFSGFARKADNPSKQPTAKAIDLAVSGPDYNVHYDYNPATNSYNRSEAGTPHVDTNTNTQLSPKVVIAMVMSYSLETDGYHSNYGVIGSGKAYIFQDGNVTVGQWNKTDNASQLNFTDANGHTIKLNAGQTWLTALRADSNITYAP